VKGIPEASFFDIALVFFSSRHKYVCEGSSMSPVLNDGDVVLVDRDVQVDVGDVVIAKHPIEQDSEVIKRIDRIDKRGHFFLLGDNLEDSNDSRHFGAVSADYIKGKVVARLK
jgi:nickel-type superoxide dismutase maturation protease